jgi:hypothetical protein
MARACGYAPSVGALEKRGSYTPKAVREKRAYQLILIGSVAGMLGCIGIVLSVVGIIGVGLPILAIAIAVVCALLFRRTVSR